MKRIFNIILFLILSLVSVSLSAKEIKVSKFAAGIENTRLLFGQYTYKNHYTAKLNCSVYSEKFGYQYMRGTIGYQTKIKFLNLTGDFFFGSAFNRTYYNTGANIIAEAVLFKRLLIDANLTPWYDSGFGYKTCWQAKLGCKITPNINVKIGYSTIPEYRMSENRILGGFDFEVSHLSVSPYISIGNDSSSGGRNIRLLFSFRYDF